MRNTFSIFHLLAVATTWQWPTLKMGYVLFTSFVHIFTGVNDIVIILMY